MNFFTRGGTHNADANNEQFSISLDKSGGYKAYQNSNLFEEGNWEFTSNESQVVLTNDGNETQIITQLTYHHYNYKVIYDPLTTPGNYIVDSAKFQKIDISNGATFIFKLAPN